MRIRVWVRAALAAALMLAPALLASGARAAEGGGNGCPWAQDVKLDFGDGRTLTVPQAIFDPKNPNTAIDGYELRPNIETLSLTIYAPRGEVWQAALTRIAGGKRCTAFYVGRPARVEEDGPSDRVAER
ncbi:hypothetical protein [Azospirillum sp. TSO22-1]|uniref:hypothetical protein n=1 Tax=Azospirillum sp. TSO22-1 TaxID=716789 RepID=UPI001FFFC9B6|nr:hypothetical protein [Azospirillum sp. TSO22-1]